jgi:hypothetical protein
LCSWVDERPTSTLKELARKINGEFGKIVSKNYVARNLKEFHYMLKNVVLVPESRNCIETKTAKKIYALGFYNIQARFPLRNIIFVDETGLYVEMRRRKVIH